MGAAAGLEIKAYDIDEADATRAHGRLDRHGFDEPGIGFQLGIGDPLLCHVGVLVDAGHEFGRDCVLVEAGIGNVEIEAAFAIADGAACHGVGQNGGEEMQGCVNAHARIADGPIKPECDIFARLGQGRTFCGDMDDLRFVLAIDGGRDADRCAIRKAHLADIAGLPAACRVEHGAVKDDAAALIDGENGGVRFAEIGIEAEEQFGHHAIKSGFMVEVRSSQGGTGRSLERRKAGLYNLDA